MAGPRGCPLYPLTRRPRPELRMRMRMRMRRSSSAPPAPLVGPAVGGVGVLGNILRVLSAQALRGAAAVERGGRTARHMGSRAGAWRGGPGGRGRRCRENCLLGFPLLSGRSHSHGVLGNISSADAAGRWRWGAVPLRIPPSLSICLVRFATADATVRVCGEGIRTSGGDGGSEIPTRRHGIGTGVAKWVFNLVDLDLVRLV